MPNPYFRFKEFVIHQEHCAMKVTTDACLFGAWVAAQVKKGTLLDIGAGTGLLSLMLAQAGSEAIDAVEIQEPDYRQAVENVRESKWEKQIRLINADVRLYPFNTMYDTIVSNPPFYESDLKGKSGGKNIAHHDEGLLLPDLLQVIKKQLQREGGFYLLFPAKREAALLQEIAQAGYNVHSCCYVKQTEQHEPFRIMIEAGSSEKEIQKQEIIIRERGNYSNEFIELLRPYYLHF
ncbi:MAG: methyltransferase [Niabella sp.]|nr:methyltransferase [Niabella sp.]